MMVERKWAEFAISPPPRSGRRMYVSLNPKGVIVLNRRTYAALGEPEAVCLLFDIDNLSIGLRPCDLLMPNAFPLAPRGKSGGHVIWAMSFTRAHQIFPTATIRFLNPVIENGILVLDLNHTARTTQSPRRGWRKRASVQERQEY